MNYGYIRNSRVSQENSVETQKKLIINFCEINNIHLDDIIIDFGISGSGDKTHLRDGYNSLLKRVENNEVDNIIVLSLSRFGRNLGEIYKSVELMEKHHTKFYSIKENVDTSSIYGKFTINLLGSLYEMELNILKERVVDTLRVKKDNNKVYSPTPYGFDRVGDDLVENKKEKRLLNKIVRLKENGLSYGNISKYLTKNRHKTKSGGKWTRENVYSVMKTHLKNEKITPVFC